jgi:hypothetical protein
MGRRVKWLKRESKRFKMTGPAPKNASSHKSRIERLVSSFEKKAFRQSYFARQLKVFLAAQIRALRGDMTQMEFGKLIGKPQSVVARLERETYGKVSLQTLIDIALKLDIGLMVRFVSFPTFLKWTDDNKELAPESYNKAQMEHLIEEHNRPAAPKKIEIVPFGVESKLGPIRNFDASQADELNLIERRPPDSGDRQDQRLQ